MAMEPEGCGLWACICRLGGGGALRLRRQQGDLQKALEKAPVLCSSQKVLLQAEDGVPWADED
jgi:hypothetical protein